ncbi:hypothetical protein JL722_6975 [Aureococcus anophagefferens]|nr:hypothetical protein JL722_6975 [Aureococcus anophagefferens]
MEDSDDSSAHESDFSVESDDDDIPTDQPRSIEALDGGAVAALAALDDDGLAEQVWDCYDGLALAASGGSAAAAAVAARVRGALSARERVLLAASNEDPRCRALAVRLALLLARWDGLPASLPPRRLAALCAPLASTPPRRRRRCGRLRARRVRRAARQRSAFRRRKRAHAERAVALGARPEDAGAATRARRAADSASSGSDDSDRGDSDSDAGDRAVVDGDRVSAPATAADLGCSRDRDLRWSAAGAARLLARLDAAGDLPKVWSRAGEWAALGPGAARLLSRSACRSGGAGAPRRARRSRWRCCGARAGRGRPRARALAETADGGGRRRRLLGAPCPDGARGCVLDALRREACRRAAAGGDAETDGAVAEALRWGSPRSTATSAAATTRSTRASTRTSAFALARAVAAAPALPRGAARASAPARPDDATPEGQRFLLHLLAENLDYVLDALGGTT